MYSSSTQVGLELKLEPFKTFSGGLFFGRFWTDVELMSNYSRNRVKLAHVPHTDLPLGVHALGEGSYNNVPSKDPIITSLSLGWREYWENLGSILEGFLETIARLQKAAPEKVRDRAQDDKRNCSKRKNGADPMQYIWAAPRNRVNCHLLLAANLNVAADRKGENRWPARRD